MNRQNWAQTLTLDASGEVFYVRLANTHNAGEYYGSLSATTSLTSAYADLHGTVNEKAVTIGDVNMDGSVNITDVIALIDYLLSGDSESIDLLAADVYQDNVVSIADVTALIDFLLTRTKASLEQSWYAVPMAKGIAINNPNGEMLEIYNLDGDCVASSNERECEAVLPAGIYMVTSDSISRKVVVK